MIFLCDRVIYSKIISNITHFICSNNFSIDYNVFLSEHFKIKDINLTLKIKISQCCKISYFITIDRNNIFNHLIHSQI